MKTPAKAAAASDVFFAFRPLIDRFRKSVPVLETTVVKLTNFRARARRRQIAPENVLVLLPRCIQRTKCDVDLIADVHHCRRCGQCPVAEVVAICDARGVRCALVGGGRAALEIAKADDVEAIVAVACEKELKEGVVAVFPKLVYAVPNERPHGPCKDTLVNLDELEQAIDRLLGAG